MQQLFRCLMMCILLCFATLSHAATIDKIIVFGDSLSDNGNLYQLLKDMDDGSPTFHIVPESPPYYYGRFSNGPVWVEKMATLMNIPFEDHAFGGAWAQASDLAALPIELNTEVEAIYEAEADVNKENHLYVVWAGANDYLQYSAYLVDHALDPEKATTGAVAAIQKEVEYLINQGARYFIIPDMPDLGIIPSAINPNKFNKPTDPTLDAAAVIALETSLTIKHNEKLEAMLAKERLDHPKVKLIKGPINETFAKIMQHPETYNIKNVTNACYDGYYYTKSDDPTPPKALSKQRMNLMRSSALRSTLLTTRNVNATTCSNPDEYLFWDQMHPTAVIHQMIADMGMKLLQDNGLWSAK